MDALDRIYQPVLPAEFSGLLFGAPADLLPGTLHSFDWVELATGKVESHVTPAVMSIAPVAEFEAAVRAYAWQNPVVSHLTSSQAATVVQLSDLVSAREFRDTDFYRHCHLPLGLKHQLAASVARPGHAGAFLVNRGGSRPFTAREVELVTRLRPHVERAFTQALQAAERREKLANVPGPALSGPAPGGTPPALLALTERESEVLRWIKEGKRNAEIALILGVSSRTIHKHVEHILAKLGVETRTAAAVLM